MEKIFYFLGTAFFLTFLNPEVCFSKDLPELKTVESVDLKRYLGKWYEIARFPNRFQEGCDQATAHYELDTDEDIVVTNTCVERESGKPKQVIGDAYVVEGSNNTKLKVSFVPGWLRWTGIGRGNYWVVDLDPNYQYAVVSEPERDYLWILSRTPALDAQVYSKILIKMREQYLDPERLVKSR